MADGAMSDRIEAIRNVPSLEALYEETGKISTTPGWLRRDETAPTEKPQATPKGGSGKFGLGGLNPLGGEKSSSGTIASAGSRGVNPDRDAKGGPNKALVVVTVTAADIAAFRQGITG